MPIYEFVCESCGHVVERLQKLNDPPPAACPECGAKMAKIMSRNSFQLKGGGWYKDLYASPASSGAPEKKKADAGAGAADSGSASSSGSGAASSGAGAPAASSTSAGSGSSGSTGSSGSSGSSAPAT